MTNHQILFISFTVKVAETNFSKYQSCWDFFFEVFIWLLQQFESMNANLEAIDSSTTTQPNLHIASLQRLFSEVSISKVKGFFNLTDKLTTVQDIKSYIQGLLSCEK